MVVRRRLRAFLIPLVLYGMAGGAAYYFVDSARSGNRGLDAKQALKAQIYETRAELERVRTERSDWERRLALFRAEQIDRDLLDERARAVLGRVHRNDLVIIAP